MSDFLFATPNWLDGAMSIIDLFGIAPEYNTSNSEKEADDRAYKADVKALAVDMSIAYEKVKESYVKKH